MFLEVLDGDLMQHLVEFGLFTKFIAPLNEHWHEVLVWQRVGEHLDVLEEFFILLL
jgi:hypothetical protein